MSIFTDAIKRAQDLLKRQSASQIDNKAAFRQRQSASQIDNKAAFRQQSRAEFKTGLAAAIDPAANMAALLEVAKQQAEGARAREMAQRAAAAKMAQSRAAQAGVTHNAASLFPTAAPPKGAPKPPPMDNKGAFRAGAQHYKRLTDLKDNAWLRQLQLAQGGVDEKATFRQIADIQNWIDQPVGAGERLATRQEQAKKRLQDVFDAESNEWWKQALGDKHDEIKWVMYQADLYEPEALERLASSLEGTIDNHHASLAEVHTGRPSLSEAVKDAGLNLLGKGAAPLAYGWEHLAAQPVYAAQLGSRRAAAEKNSAWNQFTRGVSAGISAWNPWMDNQDAADVNSPEKRQALTEEGLLDSVGTRAFGDAKVPVIGWRLSGAGDFAFQMMDPTFVIGGSVAKLIGNVGLRSAQTGIRAAARAHAAETGATWFGRGSAVIRPNAYVARNLGQEALHEAAMAGRAGWWSSRSGQALERSVDDLLQGMYKEGEGLVKGADDIQRSLNIGRSRVSQSVVTEIFQSNLSHADAMDVIFRAFTEGSYQPFVTIRRQMAAGLGVTGAVGAGTIPILLGEKAIKVSTPFKDLLEKARTGMSATFTFRSRSSAEVASEGARVAAAVSPYAREKDYWNNVVRPKVLSGEPGRLDTPRSRFERLVNQVSEWNPKFHTGDEALEAGLQATMDDLLTEEFKRINTAVHRVSKDTGVPLEVAAMNPLVQEHLATIESFVSMALGEGGEAARQAVATQLRAGYTNDITGLTSVMRQARSNLHTWHVPGSRRVQSANNAVKSARAAREKFLAQAEEAIEIAAHEGRRAGIALQAEAKAKLPKATLAAIRHTLEYELVSGLRKTVSELKKLRDTLTAEGRKATRTEEAQLRAMAEKANDLHARLANIDVEVADIQVRMRSEHADILAAAEREAVDVQERMVAQAVRNLEEGLEAGELKGWGLLDPAGTVAATDVNLAAIEARIDNLPPNLRDSFKAEIQHAAESGQSDLYPIVKELVAVMNDPRLMNEAEAVLHRSRLRSVVEIGDARVEGHVVDAVARQKSAGIFAGPKGLNPIRGSAAVVLSIMESKSPSAIRFFDSANPQQAIRVRVQDGDRALMALGFNRNARAEFTRLLSNPRLTEGDVKGLVEMAYAAFAVREGVSPDTLVSAARRNWTRNERAFGIANPEDAILSKNGKRVVNADDLLPERNVQVVAQNAETINLIDPDDLFRMVREQRVKRDGFLERPIEATRVGIAKVIDRPIAGLQRKGKDVSLRFITKGGHRFWKMAVVTNLPNVALGVVGGFVYTDGDVREKLMGSAKWGFIGALTSVRYILRVPVVEEGFRQIMTKDQLIDANMIPFWSRYRASRDNMLPARLSPDVGGWNHPMDVLEHKFGTSFGENWIPIAVGDTRYIDSWWRVANYQIHPLSDPLTANALSVAAGRMTRDEALEVVEAWFRTSEGRSFARRIAETPGGKSTPAELFARYEKFVNYHLPTADLARARLEYAELNRRMPRQVFKDARQAGNAPRVIHGQETWRMPRNTKQFFESKQVLTRGVLETPTTVLNRIPMAKRVYAEDYRRMVAQGMSPEMAREMAEQSAILTTNRVMFVQGDESRFSSKADLFAPFQQPREEMIRVYLNLFSNNKGRVMELGRLAAVGFNNGKESGMFYKDDWGTYRMVVPGSAWMSRMLGGPKGFTYDISMLDATFLLRGMQGSPGDWANIESVSDVVMGTMLVPGGPYWNVLTRMALNRMPDVHEKIYGTWAYDTLFPFSATGQIYTPMGNKFWMAMTGTVPPWEIGSRTEQENTLRNLQQQVYLEMGIQNRLENPKGIWEPDIEEVEKATRDLLTVWSVVSGVTPASVRVRGDATAQVNELMESYYTKKGDPAAVIRRLLDKDAPEVEWTREFDFKSFREDHPELIPFMPGQSRKSEWVGEQTYESWEKEGSEAWVNFVTHNRVRLSLERYADTFQEAKRNTQMWDDYFKAAAVPFREQRTAAFVAFDEKYGNRFNYNSRDWQVQEVVKIRAETPAHLREQAYNEFRLRLQEQGVNLSWKNWQAIQKEASNYTVDPWKSTMTYPEIMDYVDAQTRKRVNLKDALDNLKPAEQIKYWNYRRVLLTYDGDPTNASAFLAEDEILRKAVNEVYKNHPELTSSSRTKDEEKQRSDDDRYLPLRIKRWRQSDSSYVGETMEELTRLKDAAQLAYDEGRHADRIALQNRRRELSDELMAYRNYQYREAPQMTQEQRELRGLIHFLAPAGKESRFANRIRRAYEKQGVPYYETNEEMSFFNRSLDGQAAYVADLGNRLDLKPPEGETYIENRIFWSYLTDFQRDLVMRNYPREKVEEWMGLKQETSSRSRRRGYGRGSWARPTTNVNEGGAALRYAYDILTLHNKRTGTAPAAYAQYLELPQNPAVRADFLRKHPEVGEWIKLGPMSNMSEIERYIVIDVMVRHGKWEGEPRDWTEITELAWAREQLSRWNLRESSIAPEAYYAWLEMPSGIAKAEYLAANPEIAEWLKLGPMRNMPDAYQEVVRDIMMRYGEWTESQDPLGQTLTEFYSIPPHSRAKFIEQHPELEAYFTALRTPEEQRMYDLAERYFSMPVGNARAMFMAAYPELKDHFISQRTKRYERFMNQVAVYMGANPELFSDYLERQEDILAELVIRYGEPHLLSEIRNMGSVGKERPEEGQSRGESGRKRRVK